MKKKWEDEGRVEGGNKEKERFKKLKQTNKIHYKRSVAVMCFIARVVRGKDVSAANWSCKWLTAVNVKISEFHFVMSTYTEGRASDNMILL